MQSLDMTRLVEQVRLSDMPGAPVVSLDLHADSIEEYTRTITLMGDVFAELSESIEKGKPNFKKMAKLYKRILDATIGKDQREEVYGWLGITPQTSHKDVCMLTNDLVGWVENTIVRAMGDHE